VILGIDTSTKTCGVALWNSEANRSVAHYTLTSRQYVHSTKLLPMVSRVLADPGLEPAAVRAIAVAEGPGSFTGLRIGVTAAKVLSYAWRVPVVPVSTLEILVQAIPLHTAVAALVDARNQRVYALVRGASGERLGAPGQLHVRELAEMVEGKLDAASGLLLVGSGARAYGAYIADLLSDSGCEVTVARPELNHPSPSVLCRIAAARMQGGAGWDRRHTMELTPNYLRRSSAERENPNTGGGEKFGGTP